MAVEFSETVSDINHYFQKTHYDAVNTHSPVDLKFLFGQNINSKLYLRVSLGNSHCLMGIMSSLDLFSTFIANQDQ